MQKTPHWKPLLIIVVLALSALSLYPPQQRLKPGLDLAGGTTLIYQVDVPEDASAEQVIDNTIEVLKSRVDPNGLMNLVWRRQGGNRIEIQMAHPSTDTARRRTRYLELRESLLADHLSRSALDSALRAPVDQRPTLLAQLSGGHTTRRGLLEDLAAAYDALERARAPYIEVQEVVRAKQEEANKLDVESSDRKEADERLVELQKDLTAKTRAYLAAQKRYETAYSAVIATGVEVGELDGALLVLNSHGRTPERNRELFERAVERLIQRHPDRQQQIQELVDAYADYEKVKGQLDDPNDLIAMLRGSGVLEFRIAPVPDKVPDLKDYRDQLRQRGPRAGTDRLYRWYPMEDVGRFFEDPEVLRALRPQEGETPDQHQQRVESIFANRGLIGQAYADDYYVLLGNGSTNSLTKAHEGWRLTDAHRTIDQNGFPAVSFVLNVVGGQYMGDLTGNHVNEQMAIVLDGRVKSAPVIQSRITQSGIITGGQGGFTERELDYLIRTLQAGSLEARLGRDPIAINSTGPQFGQDNLYAGLRATLWAFTVVAVIMLVYYLFSGLVADLALAANIVIILGVMAMLRATFTLPGIAGVVLTIGMAVDANVLIFERIREELERKNDIATSMRLGYQKALSAIIDSNLTTLITCVILGYTGTVEIKGFAMTLGIGLVASMFTAIFCTRVILEYYVRWTGARTVHMLPTLIPTISRLLTPKINWMGLRYVFAVVSLALIVAGVVAVAQRGKDLLDIEFRSGTQVTFKLAEGKTLGLSEVRQRLDEAASRFGLAELASGRATVVTVGQAEQKGVASAFSVATLETDASAVSQAIKEALADVLVTERPVKFKGEGTDVEAVPSVIQSPVYVVQRAELGENINMPQIETDVEQYLGGVAIVVQDMEPPLSIAEVESRLQRMRMQPQYEGLGYRQSTVVGLELAAEAAPAVEGKPRFRSVAVLTRDEMTNYIEKPDVFEDAEGLAATEWALVHDALKRDTSLGAVSNFSSQVSTTMQQKAVVAMVLSLLALLVYIGFRFGSLRYGLGAILAIAHDVLIALGLLAMAHYVADTPLGQALLLTDFKINLAAIAGLLTLVGYSVNDTIVVFDRIRENRGRLAFATPAVINDSINQTFSRTMMTSLTTVAAVLSLYIFGGEGVRGFAFIMFVGVTVGTYSSVAVAAPILILGRTNQNVVQKKPVSSAA